MELDTPLPARFLVISSSLHPASRSRLMARLAFHRLEQIVNTGGQDQSVAWLDLAEHPLPLCDGQAAYRDPKVAELAEQIAAARGVLVASPIYNFDVNSALKNLVELTSRAWQDKVVGLMCAAGAVGSYMSLMPFANSLMLDFRCLVLPRFVYATGNAFAVDAIQDVEIQRRVLELADRFYTVAQAVPLPIYGGGPNA